MRGTFPSPPGAFQDLLLMVLSRYIVEIYCCNTSFLIRDIISHITALLSNPMSLCNLLAAAGYPIHPEKYPFLLQLFQFFFEIAFFAFFL